MNVPSKSDLLERGRARLLAFCGANGLEAPAIDVQRDRAHWVFGVCAYYRPTQINLCLPACAAPGTVGRAWSWPGYSVDRTPYGVLQHELGHHVDITRSSRRGAYFGDFSIAIRGAAGEEPISSYGGENDAEWFAEAFRLFVTNPDLLKRLRPRTYRELIAAKLQAIEPRPWRDVLAGAPERTIVAAQRKIDGAAAGDALDDLFAARTAS